MLTAAQALAPGPTHPRAARRLLRRIPQQQPGRLPDLGRPAGVVCDSLNDAARTFLMNELALLRVLHVLGVVIWIGGPRRAWLRLNASLRRGLDQRRCQLMPSILYISKR